MITNKRLAWLLAFVYCTSYITRINFAAIIQEIVTSTGFAKSTLSSVLVCISMAYGLGQIINGRIGDKIKPQNLMFIGLIIVTAMNIILPFFAHSVPMMCILWTVNGFAQAMMWPPIVKIMVSTMDDRMYGKSVVIVAVGSAVGTIAVYLVAPLIINLIGWEAVFYTSAVIGIITTVVWAFLKDKTYNEDIIVKQDQTMSESVKRKKFVMPKEAIFPFVFIAFGIIFQGMLRDGVSAWMPTYLAEVFDFGNSASILCTVSLAIFSLIVYLLVGKIYAKFFKNEVACSVAIYFVALISALFLVAFNNASSVMVIILMTLITGGAHGVNLMLISHTVKRFKKHGNISTFTGLVNSFTYVGASIATYGVAKISELLGWGATTLTWLGIALLGTVCCIIAMPKWKKFSEQ